MMNCYLLHVDQGGSALALENGGGAWRRVDNLPLAYEYLTPAYPNYSSTISNTP